MNNNCGTDEKSGQELVDFIREKGKQHVVLSVRNNINCKCGTTFLMETAVDQCPNCYMTYGVTPCSASDATKIKAAGIQY